MNVPSILSAIYAPCEGGQTTTTTIHEDPIASTRDVTLQVRALLALAMRRHDIDNDDNHQHEGGGNTTTTTPHQKNRHHHPSRIVILDGKYDGGMNVLFGDPVPGTSKRLEIRYVYDGRPTPVHTASFAEHEEVVLAKRFVLHNNHDDGDGDGDGSSSKEEDQNKESATTDTTLAASSNASTAVTSSSSSSSSCSWTLSHAVSEMVLPYALEFLDLRERVRCRTVCAAWRFIIQRRGVAVRIDDGDTTTFPITTNNKKNTTSTPFLQFHSILIGLLANSHASLTALALSGTPHVAAEIVHSALPHLRRLASLDISRCVYLGSDETLRLLAVCGTRDTLRVLYLKGPLPAVTSAGLIDVVTACRKIRVLDISYLTQLGDESMVAIGRHLTQLRSLFLRDNYRITSTNDIVVVAARNDDDDSVVHQYQQQRLEQLTVWGCTGLRQLRLGSADTLAVVNLWGCHSLCDDAADAFRGFAALRSLNVAECHRLTDEFVITLVRHVPQLHHLSLRYCKCITDRSVEALATGQPDLQTLDFSFCTRISVAALATLLRLRGHVLTELRLWHCRLRGTAGPLARAIQSLPQDCALCVMDLRHCSLLDRNDVDSTALRRALLSEPWHFVDQSSQVIAGLFTREPRGGRAMEHRYISYYERSIYGNRPAS